MASERITAHCGVDGDRDDACWLELDGSYLLGELRPKSHAQGLADRLNAAFKKTRAACIAELVALLDPNDLQFSPGLERAIKVLKRGASDE